jgi:predicted DNA binding protein
MATIVRATIPADEFALHHSISSVPGLEFEIERVVNTGGQSVMPLLWVRGIEDERASEAFDEDPTISQAELVATFDEERLYRMEWVDHVELLLQMITNHNATILDAYGKGDRWQVRVMYPNRDDLSAIHEFCNSHGLSFDVASIREMEGEPAGRYGLTTEQFEALTTAAEQGLFKVPREVTLEELAEQALSERIRRATDALVEDALMVGLPD